MKKIAEKANLLDTDLSTKFVVNWLEGFQYIACYRWTADNDRRRTPTPWH